MSTYIVRQFTSHKLCYSAPFFIITNIFFSRKVSQWEDGIYLSRNRQDAGEAGYFAFGE